MQHCVILFNGAHKRIINKMAVTYIGIKLFYHFTFAAGRTTCIVVLTSLINRCGLSIEVPTNIGSTAMLCTVKNYTQHIIVLYFFQ